jgi:hypothetical protein
MHPYVAQLVGRKRTKEFLRQAEDRHPVRSGKPESLHRSRPLAERFDLPECFERPRDCDSACPAEDVRQGRAGRLVRLAVRLG